jgi:hypothetical protein
MSASLSSRLPFTVDVVNRSALHRAFGIEFDPIHDRIQDPQSALLKEWSKQFVRVVDLESLAAAWR